MPIRVELKKCRELRGMGVKELSMRTGISKTTLYDIENGNHTPTLYHYTKICIALGINPFNELLVFKKIQ